MPPYIEVDSHHDEDCWRPARPPLVLSNDQPSPLFLDYDSITAQSSPSAFSLSRQQSNPDSTAVVLKEDPVKKAAAPVVSVITAIIGPESAYVRNTCGGGGAPNSPAAASSSAASNKRQRPAEPTSSSTSSNSKPSSPNGGPKGKIEKPMLLRATRYVSKKGWKVVKSLPNRLATTAGSVRVPGRHRNVV